MYQTPIVILFVLIFSLPLIFRLAPGIIPPKRQVLQITPADELNDLSLFRRATAVNHRPKSRPKVAFLFLTNSALSFTPLWHRFFSTAASKSLFNIYVHLDPNSSPSLLTGVFSGRHIAGRRTERASPTLISAERRLLAAALLDDPDNNYFALISQSCIPLHSFPFVYKSLFGYPNKPFSSFFSKAPKSFIEILDQEPTLPDRYDARGKGVMLPEVPFEEFRVGSQFFILTRKHALTVIRDRRLWRKFKLPCLNLDSCYPEEHYFPTLLSMEDPKGCAGFTLTRVNWTDSVGGHPHTYQPPEVTPDLIDRLRESGETSSYSYLFARKFSSDCLKPLMDIADDEGERERED
ncbi:hypothetical protein V2J09_008228 [Rumex salicifolius]